MDLFNNREIALGIWMLPLLFFLFNGDIRHSVGKCISSFLSPKISGIFVIAIFYIIFIVTNLNDLSIWNSSQLKNTILWGLTAGIVSLFSVNKALEEPNYFRTVLLENFRIILILEFLIGFYTFELWQELIIVPILVVISGMIAFAEGKEKYRTVLNILYTSLFIYGVIVTVRTFSLISENLDKFAKTETLSDFTLPIILSTLFLPFLFCLSLYMRYETALIRINILTDDRTLRRYAKWKAMISFKGKPTLIERWVRGLYTEPLKTKENIRNSIEDILNLWHRENNPKPVPFNEGWCPYKAVGFLKEIDLKAGYYQPGYQDEWGAESNSLNIDSEALANNIIYIIEGNSEAATSLKLKLYVNHAETAKDAHEVLLGAANTLSVAALEEELPEDIINAILHGETAETILSGKCCQVLVEAWPQDAFGEYDIRFIIQNNED